MITLEHKLLEKVRKSGGASLSDLSNHLNIHNNTAKDLVLSLNRQGKVRILRDWKGRTVFITSTGDAHD
jgi:predicted ArsR family transcriptional regulator